MTDVTRSEPAITPETVRTAVGMLTCRLGTPEAEADRRGRVRALVQSSRALAMALDHFARKATPHTRGEHATSDMHADADAMAQALADWSFAMSSSAATFLAYRAEARSRTEHRVVRSFPQEHEQARQDA
jgi:hypothetical protein